MSLAMTYALQASSKSEDISEYLELAGSGGFDGKLFSVSASASFTASRIEANSVYNAFAIKRVYETGAELLDLDPSRLPVLSMEAAATLRRSEAAFEATYGEAQVHVKQQRL